MVLVPNKEELREMCYCHVCHEIIPLCTGYVVGVVLYCGSCYEIRNRDNIILIDNLICSGR